MVRTLGMLIPEFPSQTHAFFWREIKAIEAAGVRTEIVSTRRPARSVCRHEFADAARLRTHYLFPPPPGALLVAALSRGHGLPRVARYVAGLKESTVLERSWVLGLVPSALALAGIARRRGIEHIHVHSCSTSAHVAAMSYLLGGPPYSLHLHGDLVVYGKDHASKMRHAAFVAAAAQPMELQAVQMAGVAPARACTSWMGVETSSHLPPERRAPSDTLRLITVARLNRAKGHEYVLQAMARVLQAGVDVRYVVAGTGPYEADIRRVVQVFGLAERVTFTGTLSEAEVLAQLHQADVFVLASVGRGEASPVAVMEAMSTGLPVICSRIGGTPQMIQDGQNGFLVERKDVAGIAQRLLELAHNPGVRRSIGEAARRSAVERFDVQRTAAHLLELVNTYRARGDDGRACA